MNPSKGIINLMDFTLHTDFPSEMEQEWNDLLKQSTSHVPFLRFEYLAEWWKTRGGGEWPADTELAIITAREGARLAGIAPLFIAQHEGKRQLLLLGSIEISDYLDLICREAELAQFCSELLVYIKKQLVDTGRVVGMDLYNIIEDSPTLKALEAAAQELGAHFTKQSLQQAPCIFLPKDWETYLQGLDKKQRHEIRRKLRRSQESQEQIEVYFTEDADKLESDIQDFLELMAQDEDKKAFLTPLIREQMQAAMRCAFQEGCLQLAFLVIGGHKAAAYMSFDYLNRIWVYNSGLDRQYMSYSPGWVLLSYLVQRAIKQGRQEFDFMRGDEEYKYKFGARDCLIMRVTIDF